MPTRHAARWLFPGWREQRENKGGTKKLSQTIRKPSASKAAGRCARFVRPAAASSTAYPALPWSIKEIQTLVVPCGSSLRRYSPQTARLFLLEAVAGLAKARGEVVTKDELIEQVWVGSIVALTLVAADGSILELSELAEWTSGRIFLSDPSRRAPFSAPSIA